MYGTLSVEALFYFASQFMNIKQFNKNEVIYYQGDIANNIYFVLLGKVLLRKLNIVYVDYSAEEYFLYLKSIEKDVFLLEKTIEVNNEIFPVRSIDEIDELKLLITKAKILKHASSYEVDSLIFYFKIMKINPTLYGFDEVIRGEESIQTFYEDFLYSLTQTEMFYIKQLNNYSKIKVSIYEYIPTAEKRKLEYFGNYKLSNSISKREESAVALSKTIMIEISKKMYTGCILNDQKQLKEKELDHLHMGYFFKGIKKNVFQKYIFHEFDLVEYSKDHVLFNENDQVDTFFIIKEGNVELSLINKSIVDIKNIIVYIKTLDERFQAEQFNDTIQLINSPKVLMPYLKEKRNFVLMKTASNVFCDWEFHYEVKALYTARVCSDRTRMYQIPLSKIRINLDEDLSIFNRYLKDAAYKKLSNLLKRIIMIKNAAIEKIDIEFAARKKKIENEEMLAEDQMVLSKSNEKVFKIQTVDYKKNETNANAAINNNTNADNSSSAFQTIISDSQSSRHRKNISLKCIESNYFTKQSNNLFNKKKCLVSKEKSFPESLTYRQQTDSGIKGSIELIKSKKKFNVKSESYSNNNNNHSTIIGSPVILPRLNVVIPSKKIKKTKAMSFKLNQKTKKRIISIDLPQEASHSSSQLKNLNYLAVQKFYEENKIYRKMNASK